MRPAAVVLPGADGTILASNDSVKRLEKVVVLQKMPGCESVALPSDSTTCELGTMEGRGPEPLISSVGAAALSWGWGPKHRGLAAAAASTGALRRTQYTPAQLHTIRQTR